MPCKSDYQEPTPVEVATQRAAAMYVLVSKHLGLPVDEKIQYASTYLYANDRSIEPALCKLLGDWFKKDQVEFEAFVFDGRTVERRELAAWWQRHQEADAARTAVEPKLVTSLEVLCLLVVRSHGFTTIEHANETVEQSGLSLPHATEEEQMLHTIAALTGFDTFAGLKAAVTDK